MSNSSFEEVFRVWGVEYQVWGVEFKVWGLRCEVEVGSES